MHQAEYAQLVAQTRETRIGIDLRVLRGSRLRRIQLLEEPAGNHLAGRRSLNRKRLGRRLKRSLRLWDDDANHVGDFLHRLRRVGAREREYLSDAVGCLLRRSRGGDSKGEQSYDLNAH